VPKPAPLDPDEELVWRALNRIMVALPRALDEDLVRETGLSLNAYATLMNLSEAENQEMRMADLAAATALSASRITRLVDELQERNMVTKRKSGDDGRGNVARLTPEGLKRLKAAYPHHLKSARTRVMDLLDPALSKRLGKALGQVADGLPGASRV
jgi:DNA-binding MarR family transcriptional regulator